MIVQASAGNIARAAELLQSGEIVAFPTETVYGLGANVYDAGAVARIFEVKGRPKHDPLIVHIADIDTLQELCELTVPQRAAVEMLKGYWPGPLSLVLPRSRAVSDLVTAGLDSVAVRMPANPVALELIRACGFPIAAPSANPFGYVSPTTAQHVADSLANKVPLILDGGPCEIGVESTVLSLTGENPVLLRPGAVTLEELERVFCREIQVSGGGDGAERLSPGMLDSHYKPSTPIRFLEELDLERCPPRVGLIRFSGSQSKAAGVAYAVVLTLSSRGDLGEIASKLFAALRKLDQMALDLIVVDSCAQTGLGRAIMDRLTRAVGRN